MKQLVLTLSFVLVLGACGPREKPNFTFMPDMAHQPSIKAQELGGMETPPEGTIPRGYKPYPYKGNPEVAGRELRNPLTRTKAVLKRGQEMYNIYCIVCHGAGGEGDGTIVPKFPRPPSLLSDKVRDWPDGRIFHVITDGQNLMPSYASQVDEEDRWAVAHYIRVLYRAKNPTASDLKAAEKW